MERALNSSRYGTEGWYRIYDGLKKAGIIAAKFVKENRYGGEGGILTLVYSDRSPLSAISKRPSFNRLAGLRKILNLAAAKNALKSRRATQQT